jgi:arsenate reductase
VDFIREEDLTPSMSEPVRAYIRKGCLTCKRALDYMRAKGVEFQVSDLFKEPLTREDLKDIVSMLGIHPSELLRTRDRMYRELDLRNWKLSDEELLDLMVKYPGLIKRPILVRGNRAIVALEPEQVESVLQ